MRYSEPKNLKEIVTYTEGVLADVDSQKLSIANGAANIVGATLSNNSFNVRPLFDSHPLLEECIELCASLELYDETKYLHAPGTPKDMEEYWQDIVTAFTAVRESL